MKRIVSVLGVLIPFLMATGVSRAQLLPPNKAGVTMGYAQLNVRDVEASRKFFLRLGGTPVKRGNTQGVRYPGLLLFLTKADPSGDTEGSAVDHLGFMMKDGVAFLGKLRDEGVKTISNGLDAQGREYGGYVYSPDGMKIEIMERGAPTVPVRLEHVHFFVADPGPAGGPGWSELQSWYTQVFGADATLKTLINPAPGNAASAPMSQSILAGTPLRFSPARFSAGTRGRAMDHLGFEVKNLEAFCQQLQAKGIRLDVPYHREDGIGTAYLTDPAGTYIELTEGLDRL